MLLNHKAAAHRPTIRIGCSGWQYRHWRGDFYPADLPAAGWFEHYARSFDTVEINNSFYRLPEAATFATWAARAPADFLYAVKASRYLTHMKKLKDPEEPLARFFDRAKHLIPKLGPVLYQLPPRWPLDLDRLRHFLDALPRGYRHVMEFREPSWYDDRVFALLGQHGVALCLHDMAGSATGAEGRDVAARVARPPAVRPRGGTRPLVYARFHGATKYSGRYEDHRLDEWAGWLAARAHEGVDVFAYFNNDVGGHAPRDAARLRDRVLRATRVTTTDSHEATRSG